MKRREFLQTGVACSLLPLTALKSPSVPSSQLSSKSHATNYPLSGCKQDEHIGHDWALVDYELKDNEFWMTWFGYKCIATQLSLEEVPKWIRVIPEHWYLSRNETYIHFRRTLVPDFLYFAIDGRLNGDYELNNFIFEIIGGLCDWERVCLNCGMTLEQDDVIKNPLNPRNLCLSGGYRNGYEYPSRVFPETRRFSRG